MAIAVGTKIHMHSHNDIMRKAFPNDFNATVTKYREDVVTGDYIEVEIDAADYAAMDSKFQMALPFPRWTAMVADCDIEIYPAPEAPAPAEPETYTVRLPDTGWERLSKFETSRAAELKLEDGKRLFVEIIDDSRRDDYIIGEVMLVNKRNEILEYLDWDQIRLIGYDGTERGTTFSDLWGILTAAETAKTFGLAEATVRQAINRGELPARKSAGTWIVRRKDAQARWGKR